MLIARQFCEWYSPSLPRLDGAISSSQLQSSVVIADGLQLLFPWSSSSTVSSKTWVYSFKLKWSSSSDGSNFKSSSTANQLSLVLFSTSERRLVMRQGGGSRMGVSSRFKLRLTNSMLGICERILKTCWTGRDRKILWSGLFLKRWRWEIGSLSLGSEVRATFREFRKRYCDHKLFSVPSGSDLSRSKWPMESNSPHSNFPACSAPSRAP